MRHLKKGGLALLAALFILITAGNALAAELPKELVPVGMTAGITLNTDGILVVNTNKSEDGTVSPAQEAGLTAGDIITHFNGKRLTTVTQLHEALNANGAKPVKLGINRASTRIDVELTPAEQDGAYQIGAWVRDCVSGIGTVTFYDPATGVFGALGHGINDNETRRLLPISGGLLNPVSIMNVQRGAVGQPGELKGIFNTEITLGNINANTDRGVFGNLYAPPSSGYKPMPVGNAPEVGKARIIATVSGDTPGEYDIEIVKVYKDSHFSTRNFMIRVTDQRLLDATGGIVQGMSGSPVLQNGNFVGAVTHVLVGDPQRGYGITIDNMMRMAY